MELEKLKKIIGRIRYDSLWVVSTGKLPVSSERIAEIAKALGI